MTTRLYSDGGLTQLEKNHDEIMILGNNSLDEKAQNFQKDGGSFAIVTTSGNKYLFGDGLIINANTGKINRFPAGDLVVRVGSSLKMPGIANTSSVQSIELELEQPDFRTAFKVSTLSPDIEVDIDSPFDAVRTAIENARLNLSTLSNATPAATQSAIR